MIEQGENIKYIQTQLGHSSPTVTLNVYAHLMKPTNQDAVCRLEKTIFGNGDFWRLLKKQRQKMLKRGIMKALYSLNLRALVNKKPSFLRALRMMLLSNFRLYCVSVWWAVQDLNLRLPPCEDGTLPLS